jgi:hypothetical protein
VFAPVDATEPNAACASRAITASHQLPKCPGKDAENRNIPFTR